MSIEEKSFNTVHGEKKMIGKMKKTDVRAVLCNQRLVVDNFVDGSFENYFLHPLCELESRLSFCDRGGRRIASCDNCDSSVSRERRLQDLSELRVPVRNVRPGQTEADQFLSSSLFQVEEELTFFRL